MQAAPRFFPRWSWPQPLLASFLTLFAELVFIRWIAVEIRVFAYFNNLALLLCFLHFGFGGALARHAFALGNALPAFKRMLIAVRLPIPEWRSVLEGLSQHAAGDVESWTSQSWQWAGFLSVTVATGILLYFLTFLFRSAR